MGSPGTNGNNGDRPQGPGYDPAASHPSTGESVAGFLIYLLRIFATRIWAFLLVFAAVLGAMVYSTYRSTPVYQAYGEILIERQSPGRSGGILEEPLLVNTDEADYYNTQAKILQGPGMADRVAKHLNLDPSKASGLMGSLSVVLARNNRIIEIYFEHTDPKFAADVVNAYIAEYEQDTIDRRRNSINTLFKETSQQLQEVKADLDLSEKKLRDFREKHGMLLDDEKESVLRHQLHEAGIQVLRERNERARLESIAMELIAAGNDIARIRSVATAHSKLGAQDEIRMELTRAEEELAQMAQRVTKTHPSYLAAEARLKEVFKKYDEQAQQFAQGIRVETKAAQESVKRSEALYDEFHKKNLDQDKDLAEAELLRRERDSYRALYDALLLHAMESKISSAIELTNIQRLHDAVEPGSPIRPNMPLNVMIGVVLALISGAAAIVLLDRIDNTVRTTEDVESAYDIPVVSVIPLIKNDQLSAPAAVACWKEEHSQLAESFRRVRAAILLSVRGPQGGAIRQILIASPGPDEGKTITATNLAISLAQMGERTLFIDADFYRSESHKLFGLDREKGLSTALVSDISLAQAIQPTSVPFLDYLGTGMIPPQPATLLGSARMAWVLQEAARTYSRVVIDTAPLVAVTDASLLAPHADATLLVVRDGKTSKTALRRSLQTLARIGVRPTGFVFNGVRTGMGEFYFKYHHPSYALEPESRQPSGKA